MIVELGKIVFVNDFAYIDCNNGSTLVLNKLDEAITNEDGELLVRNVNIAILDIDGNYYDCNMAIGLSNDLMRLYSNYKEQEGQILTLDNLSLCYIEVFDE